VHKNLTKLPGRLATLIGSYRLLVESEVPVPRNWHDPTSVERYQARLDSERNVLMKLNEAMLIRCRR